MSNDKPLDKTQLAQFNAHGFVLLENALDVDTLARLTRDFRRWRSESRNYVAAYGEQKDGRPRFGVEPGHSYDKPALRRVASPVELSETYLDVMRNGAAVDAVAQLIGPNVKFNNSKINSKYPDVSNAIEFHQDFMFEPHSNDDLVTVLYFLDELTRENGALQIVPGSHRGPLYDHWIDGVFMGCVGPEIALQAREDAISCTGQQGSACLMNTRLLHGSAPNYSSDPRSLYIVEYCAEDAYPLQANHIPSEFEGDIVRGRATNLVRCSDYEMEFPEFPDDASFFEQQSRLDPK